MRKAQTPSFPPLPLFPPAPPPPPPPPDFLQIPQGPNPSPRRPYSPPIRTHPAGQHVPGTVSGAAGGCRPRQGGMGVEGGKGNLFAFGWGEGNHRKDKGCALCACGWGEARCTQQVLTKLLLPYILPSKSNPPTKKHYIQTDVHIYIYNALV